MFHLATNFVALGAVADTDVPALNDDVLAIQNGHHVPEKDVRLMASYASSVTHTRSRYNSPKIRQITPFYIQPIGVALLPITRPQVMDLRSNPFTLRGQEEIVVESTNTTAGTENHCVLSWLDYGWEPAPVGDIFNLRGTSTTAAVANTWTTITMTWQNTLPAGTYAVIGGTYQATNAVAFSVIFQDQYPRPGGLGMATLGLVPWEGQVYGGLGVWGRFTTVTLPRVRVLNNSTDNAHVVYLQIVRVR